MANTVDAPRLAAVARMIRQQRTGATLEEIVEAAQLGLVSEDEAVRALEKGFEEACRNRWQVEVPSGFTSEREVDVATDPEHSAMAAEVQSVLLQALNDLPPRRRLMMELFYFEGLSAAAIGERLGASRWWVTRNLGLGTHFVAQYVGKQVDKSAPKPPNYRRDFYPYMMRAEWRRHKKTTKPFYPYQLWHKYNVEGYRAANGVYATRYENRLRSYLKDCFGDDETAIPRGV